MAKVVYANGVNYGFAELEIGVNFLEVSYYASSAFNSTEAPTHTLFQSRILRKQV